MIGDDKPIVGDRIQVERAASLANLLTENYWGDLEAHTRLYRPITLVSLGTQKLLFGEALWAYRVTSLVLHACCVFIVFELTSMLFSSNRGWTAWCGAAVFAVHPIHAEAVITLYGQADLLAAVFGLAAVCLYVRSSDRRGSSLVLALFCYLLSLGSKESGVLVPCLAILLRQVRASVAPESRSWFRQLRWLDSSWIMALCLYLAARVYVLGTDLVPSGEGSVAMEYPLAGRVKLFVVTVGEYVRMMIFPSAQTIYYGHLRDAIFGMPWGQCTVLLLSAFGLRELLERDRRAGLLVAGTFVLMLFPVSNIIPIGTVVAERAAYLPSVALAFLVAWSVEQLGERTAPKPPGKFAVLAFSILLAVASGMSWRTAQHWRTPLSLWRYTADCHPRSPKAQALAAIHVLKEMTNQSSSLASSRLLEEARDRLEIAQQLNPTARLTVQGIELLRNAERHETK